MERRNLDFDERRDDSWQNPTYLWCGAIGYCLYFAWLVAMLLVPDFSAGGEVSPNRIVLDHLLFAVGLLSSLLVLSQIAGKDGSIAVAIVLSVAAAVCCPAAPICAVIAPENDTVAAACWFVSGAGGGCLLSQYGCYLCSLNRARLSSSVPAGVGAAILVVLVITALPRILSCIATMIVAVASACLMLGFRSSVSSRSLSETPSDSQSPDPVGWRSIAPPFFNSLFEGIVIYRLSLFSLPSWEVGVCGVLFVVCSAAMIADARGKRRFTEALQLKVSLLCAIVGLLPIALFGEPGALAGCIVLVCSFAPQTITNIIVVCEGIHLLRKNPARSFPLWRLSNVVGIGAGYATAYLAFGLVPASGGTEAAVLLPLLVLFAVVSTFLYRDASPDAWGRGAIIAMAKRSGPLKAAGFADATSWRRSAA